MLAQRKIAYDESQKNYKQMKTKKLVKVEQAKNVNVNNALRSRCIILFVIVIALAGFFILRSGVAASNAYYLNQLKKSIYSIRSRKFSSSFRNSTFKITRKNTIYCYTRIRNDSTG